MTELKSVYKSLDVLIENNSFSVGASLHEQLSKYYEIAPNFMTEMKKTYRIEIIKKLPVSKFSGPIYFDQNSHFKLT